jgi:ParB-like chromosome segregation protein Spo0J
MRETMKIQWINIEDCMPPHRVSRIEQAENFAVTFRKNGWDLQKPALIGYLWENKIQLLSGSHRYWGACRAGLNRIPVVIRTYKEVDTAWGNLSEWAEIMTAPKICECDS